MKTKQLNRYKLWIGCVALFLCLGCMKDFLDIKRDKSQVTPNSLDDFRAILDANGIMNYNFPNQLAIIGADEYYIASAQWAALARPIDKNGYIWNDEIYEGTTGDDWNRGFEKVMFANFVIEGISEIPESDDNRLFRNELLGEAYFYRAMSYFLMAQLFCKQYIEDDAVTDLGLPLRTTSNINVHFSRSNLSDTYAFILADMAEAVKSLPLKTEVNTRPSKSAALALNAMVYLQMGKFGESLRSAEEAFVLNSELLDFNSVDVDAQIPFSQYGRENPEILFYAQVVPSPILGNARLTIDSNLYDSYHIDDLRKRAFFSENNERMIFKGGYSGVAAFMFSGLTTAELYLMLAECKARLSSVGEAVYYLNELRKNRLQKENFQGIPDTISQEECINIIMDERKKELIFRGRRWQDLKRYQLEGLVKSPLIRNIEGELYMLLLESKKWVWPIPPDVVIVGGIQQNER